MNSNKDNHPDTGPFSSCYVVEYHYNSDGFSVNSLQDYLTHAHDSFLSGRLFDSIVLAIHPAKQGAQEECLIWQERRTQSPVSVEKRLAEFKRYVAGLESQL